MRRRVLSATVAAVVLASGAVAFAADDPPPGGGTVTQRCYASASSSLDDPGYKFCRSLQAGEWVAGSACRAPLRTAGAPDECGVVDGRTIGEAQIAAYEKSWVHRALTLQRGLDADVPLLEEQLPHTHNSFNASAYALPTDGSLPSYYPTLTNQDPNQVYSMSDQLRMDVRVLEIDLHWVPSPFGNADTHGYWPTICHGDAEDPTGSGTYVHVGCSDDRPMQDGLAEVRRWLDSHPDQFVMIYLENQLFPGGPIASQTQAHDVAAGIIHSQLGSKVFTPPAGLKPGSCAPMPYDETRADMLAQGKQVLLVGNCGPGGWNRWVFTRGPKWDESGNPTTYGDKQCAADEAAHEAHTTFRRWYEESPWLEAMTDATQVITPATTARMVRCGVNIVGFDQLQPFDGRLAAFVWSWAKGEPSAAGACADLLPDGHFEASGCAAPRHFACVDSAGDWHVSRAAGRWERGAFACAQEGLRFGVPPNGYRDQQLVAAAADHGQSVCWLNYRREGGSWTPNALVDIPVEQGRTGR